MDLRTFVENKKRRIIDDYVNVLRNKVEDLSRVIWSDDEVDVFADQYNGKAIPFAYSRFFGPFNFSNASLSDFQLPSKPQQNIIVGREGAFHWTSTACIAIVQESISTIGGAPQPAPPPTGDLFDSFFHANGGGAFNAPSCGRQTLPFEAWDQALGFDIVLYDRKRGRALHEGKLPFEMFFGGQVTNKELAEPIRLDPNTDLEPRIFLTWPQFDQSRTIPSGLGGNEFNTDLTWWLNIMFKGRLILEA